MSALPASSAVVAATHDGRALGALESFDVSAGRRLARERRSAPVKAAAEAGKLGDQEPLYAISAALVLAGLLLRRRRLRTAGLRMGAAVAGADLLKSALKRTVTRTRPHVLLDEGRYDCRWGGSDDKHEQSFPSGHVSGAVAASLAVSRIYPGTRPWTVPACALLGWSRVGKAAHWPSDVAAGVLIGFVAEQAAHRLGDAVAARFRRESVLRP